MEISSHYYALLALCRARGLKKDVAHKVAFASQFVDDAKINCLSATNGFTIQNIATCHSYFKVKTYNFQAMLANTAAFHFIPGCEGKTFTEKLVCRENSSIINQIIDEYMENEPEVFGMLMHIYADTFAHQGFSGLLSKENDIEELKIENMLIFQDGFTTYNGLKTGFSNFFSNLKFIKKIKNDKDLDDFIPAYGHGQAEHCPDIPYLQWSYKYSEDRCESEKKEILKIDNVERYKRAFTNIKDKIDMYINKNPSYNDSLISLEQKEGLFVTFLEVLKQRESTPSKIKSWQNFLITNELLDSTDTDILTYNETLWFKDLIKNYNHEDKICEARKVSNVELVDGYEECSWLKYVVGVKNYKTSLKDICSRNGVDLYYDNYKPL